MTEYEFADPADRGDRERTLTEVIEAVDTVTPETKAQLSEEVDLSKNYLSELLKDLKEHGLIKKAYVVDESAVFEAAPELSAFVDGSKKRGTTDFPRLFERFAALDTATRKQYGAARAVFEKEEPERSAADLEPLANERSRAVFDELKSMTLSTEWPGNRVAADLGTIAMNLEIVGDRACFLEDLARNLGEARDGVIHDRMAALFDDGAEVHSLLNEILFDLDLGQLDTLYGVEDDIHRQLNELFELVTTYDSERYAQFATMSRTLEQTVYYWVHTAELAVRLHSGVTPDHISGL